VNKGQNVPETSQHVEKVVVEPVGNPKQAQTTLKTRPTHYKPGFSSPERGSENGTNEFFNTIRRF
jgi:hypothetical protein